MLFFAEVRKIFVSFDGSGEAQLLVPGQDRAYAITEFIARFSGGTGVSGHVEIWANNKLTDIVFPTTPEPVYSDGEEWFVPKETSVEIRFPNAAISGTLMIEAALQE